MLLTSQDYMARPGIKRLELGEMLSSFGLGQRPSCVLVLDACRAGVTLSCPPTSRLERSMLLGDREGHQTLFTQPTSKTAGNACRSLRIVGFECMATVAFADLSACAIKKHHQPPVPVTFKEKTAMVEMLHAETDALK
eukprot:4134191-Amphidinium_carterae.1